MEWHREAVCHPECCFSFFLTAYRQVLIEGLVQLDGGSQGGFHGPLNHGLKAVHIHQLHTLYQVAQLHGQLLCEHARLHILAGRGKGRPQGANV